MGKRQIKGEWLLVSGENFMSLQPQYYCSECGDIISTYDPSNTCRHCGSINEYKGNSISVSIADEHDILVSLTPEEIEIIRIGIEVAQFESQLPETVECEEIKNLLVKLGL